jgi:hypothetical protein
MRAVLSSFSLWVLVALCLGSSAAQAAEPTDATLDIIQYKAPPGWKQVDGATGRLYTSPDSNFSQQAAIVLSLSPPQDRLDLRAAFDTFVKQMTQSGKVVQAGDVAAKKTRQGFDALAQTLTTEANGQHVYLRVIGANVRNRLVTISYIAGPTKPYYEQHMAEFDDLLRSVSFAAGGGALAAAPGNPNGEAEFAALEKEKQQLLTRLAQIDARQRQIKGGAGPANGAVAPAATMGVPVRDEAAAIAQLAEQFNKTVDQRRKPHRVVGDILTLDGKPIPNVTTAVVAVVGTTITGGERTGYSMEVDKSGHFEMKVPDGVYRVTPRVVVTVNGHQIPADLVPVDGRVARAELSSADGIVADFRLVLGMLKPGLAGGSPDSYFGGIVSVEDPDYSDHAARVIRRHPGGKIRVTFAPITPAVDGTKLEPFAVDADAQAAAYGTERIGRIPMAAYRVSAAVAMPDGKLIPLGCSLKFNQDFMTAVDLNWTVPYEGSVLRDAVKLYVTE